MAAKSSSSLIVSSPALDPEEQADIRRQRAQAETAVDAFELGQRDAAQARADLHVQTVCLLILAILATGVGLWLLRPVLVPFVLALFFAACLKPVINFQIRYLRIPQPLAVVGATIFAIALLAGIGIPLGQAISKMWPIFQQKFNLFLQTTAHNLPERFGIKTSPGFQIPNPVFDRVSSAVGEVTNVVTGTVLVIIFTLFILLGRRTARQPATGVLAEIDVRVQRYISQMVLLSAFTGLLVGFVLAVLGVKFATMFGFLAFLLNFIPTIGSVVATLLPLPVILLSPELSPLAKILALAVPGALQIYLGNAVQPRVLGNALDLHPIVVLISLIFWSMIWGPAGAFLATPMTAVLKIILEKIPATRPLAALLAGKLELVF